MNDFLKSQSKTNELILGSHLNIDELNRVLKSDFRWADNRIKNKFTKIKVKKGEVYQFEFGKSYIPEIAYEHRGLVIGVRKRILYVLPIFSYDAQKHFDIYHPVDFPDSKSDLFLLKRSEFSFINRDSVLKLNDIRTVSTNRILYKQNGSIDISSDTYAQIENLAFNKIFPSIHYDFMNTKKQVCDLKVKIKKLEEEKNQLEKENEILKLKVEQTK